MIYSVYHLNRNEPYLFPLFCSTLWLCSFCQLFVDIYANCFFLIKLFSWFNFPDVCIKCNCFCLDKSNLLIFSAICARF